MIAPMDDPAATWQITPAPDAPAGASDVTRRWAILCPDGRQRWPGLTRGEAADHLAGHAAFAGRDIDRVLAPAQLPAVLSDGAGPHLVDARGEIVIAIADHPLLPGAVGMGGPGPEYTVGLLLGRSDLPWRWRVRARLGDDRIAALTELDQAASDVELDAWRDQWGGS